MTGRHFLLLIWKSFIGSFWWYLTILPPYFVYALCVFLSKWLNISQISMSVCGFGLVQFVIFLCCLHDEFSKELNNLKSEYKKKIHVFKVEMGRVEKEYSQRIEQLNKRCDTLFRLLNSHTPFRELAKMRADAEMIVFDESENYLRYKRFPARTSADEIRAMKKIASQIRSEALEVKYKYEYILSAFPAIAQYVEDDQELIKVCEALSYKNLEETRDKRRDYLSKVEYERLSEAEKSQLALDRYLTRPKTNWQVGRDYEMCCAYQLERAGYKVEMHGIKYGFHDLGRDIIAVRDQGGLFGKEILVVQCKNWKPEPPIRENVIMQLYGSVTMYLIENKEFENIDIIPVLMMPPYTNLSDVAQRFAKKLKIRIMRVPPTEFPRIKCNINHGEKIYHLPFDQMYDRAEIKLKDEFYAWTVDEAVKKGFRRAKRNIYTK